METDGPGESLHARSQPNAYTLPSQFLSFSPLCPPGALHLPFFSCRHQPLWIHYPTCLGINSCCAGSFLSIEGTINFSLSHQVSTKEYFEPCEWGSV